MSTQTQQLAFAIPDFCQCYAIGRSTAYDEMAAGRLKAKKIGRKTIITKEDADAWLASLPDARAEA